MAGVTHDALGTDINADPDVTAAALGEMAPLSEDQIIERSVALAADLLVAAQQGRRAGSRGVNSGSGVSWPVSREPVWCSPWLIGYSAPPTSGRRRRN